MAQGIMTRFIPCTASKGSRIKAEWTIGGYATKSVTIGYPHQLSQSDAHLFVALELIRRNQSYDGINLLEYYKQKGYNLVSVETEKGYVFAIDFGHNVVDITKQ